MLRVLVSLAVGFLICNAPAPVRAYLGFRVTQTVAGAEVPGRRARYVKLEKMSKVPGPLPLRRVEIYGN